MSLPTPTVKDYPLLKCVNFSDNTLRATVEAVREVNGTKNAGVMLDLVISSDRYAFFVPFNDSNLVRICKQLGTSETNQWIGQSITFVKKHKHLHCYVDVA